MAHRPIPVEISDAFGEAVVLLVQWKGGSDEPVAYLDGKAFKIQSIFALVADRAFKDQIPQGMQDLLQAHSLRDRERERDFAALILVPTYEVAAQCMLKWVAYKRSKRGAGWSFK